MPEISILLKDMRLITLPEYKALDKYASTGRLWTIIQRQGYSSINRLSTEYIFEEENLFMFKLISPNTHIQWFTENTRRFKHDDVYYLDTNLCIRLASFC